MSETTKSDSYERALHRARGDLEAALAMLTEEIHAYPSPIAGCDLQFNRLLSDRRRIAGALRALDEKPFETTPRALDPAPGD